MSLVEEFELSLAEPMAIETIGSHDGITPCTLEWAMGGPMDPCTRAVVLFVPLGPTTPSYCYGQGRARVSEFKVLLQERRKILGAERPPATAAFSQQHDVDRLGGYLSDAAISRLSELRQKRLQIERRALGCE